MTTFTHNDDVIDSRDIIARIEELQSYRDDWVLGAPDGTETPDPEGWAADNPEDAEELAELEKLAAEGESSPDWEHGETLIADSYFTSYIEELINDCCEMPKEMNSGSWPYRHMSIDYEAAADEAKSDYFTVEFFGNTFWLRA